MRVLVLVEACGGAARHVADLCTGLQDRGIDAHVLYSPLREDAVLRAGLLRLKARAVPVKAVAMRPEPSLSDLWAWLEIRRYIREQGPFDVIHGHSSKGGALARLFLGAGPAVKIYSPHAFVTMNPNLSLPGRALYCGLERVLALLGDAVIATSPAELVHAQSVLGIARNKLFLVPNGIAPPAAESELSRNELRRAWGIEDDEPVIGTVARFVPQKHPELLLQAFARVVQRQPKARLIMVGDGPLRQQLEKAADTLGISHRIVLPGYLDGGQVMAAFDIFALGSRYEGFPYVLLDALAAGLPVVTTAVGGAEMAVAEGINGFVVPVDSEREMAERLCLIVSDPVARAQMGAASLTLAQRFTNARMVGETLAVYAAVLDPSGRKKVEPGK